MERDPWTQLNTHTDFGPTGDDDELLLETNSQFSLFEGNHWGESKLVDEFVLPPNYFNSSFEKSRSRDRGSDARKQTSRSTTQEAMDMECLPSHRTSQNQMKTQTDEDYTYQFFRRNTPVVSGELDFDSLIDDQGIADLPIPDQIEFKRTIYEKTQLQPDMDSRKKASSGNQRTNRHFCNCEKTKCLKMYCACYREGVACSERCRCKQCYNTLANQEAITQNKEARKMSDHRHKPDSDSMLMETVRPTTKVETLEKKVPVNQQEIYCSCRMSFCEKSYCACAKAQKKCSPKCKCFHCKNSFGTRPLPPSFPPQMVKCC